MLTNYHVVADASQVGVEVRDSDNYSATLLGFDAYKDLAVLEICCGAFQTLNLIDSQSVINPGKAVISIGYALGFEGPASVSTGIVSAYRYDEGLEAWVIQTDASMNPGSSGGPLLLANGEVVGILTYRTEEDLGRVVDGVGFAISKQTIRSILTRLRDGHRVSLPTPTPIPTPTAIPVRWRTYSDVFNRFEFNVPQDWVNDNVDRPDVSFSSPDNRASVYVNISGRYFSDPEQQLLDWIDYRREGRPYLIELLSSSLRTLSGGVEQGYVKYRYQSEEQYCVSEYREWLWFHRNEEYWLSVSSCELWLEEYQPILDRIVATFNTW